MTNVFKLLSAFLKVNVQMSLAYRADTVVNILLNLMWLGWELLSLNIIFNNTETIGGWGFGDSPSAELTRSGASASGPNAVAKVYAQAGFQRRPSSPSIMAAAAGLTGPALVGGCLDPADPVFTYFPTP